MRTVGSRMMWTQFHFCCDYFVPLDISTRIWHKEERKEINFGLNMRSVLLKKNQKETHTSGNIKTIYIL